MKICFIGKFPPIEGGIAAKTYWMANGLSGRGVEVHIVTNANCVEDEYRIGETPPDSPSNIHIHFVDSDLPWHIPDSKLYVPRLLDKALQVTAENQIDVIDTGFLIPYGIVGYLVYKITGIPYIVRHGGSDLEKFLRKGVFNHLLERMIKNASAILTDHRNKDIFQRVNSRIHIVPRYIPDERYFKPSVSPHDTPTFAYIGKINYYWRYKSLHRIVEIFSGLKGNYRLIFVGQGKGFEDFSKFVSEYRMTKSQFRQFVHPANMPRSLNEIDFLICFAKDNPIQDFSNIFCEALWSGITVLTDDTIDPATYTECVELAGDAQILNLPIDDVETTRSELINLIEGWKKPQRFANTIKYHFNTYLDANLRVYGDINNPSTTNENSDNRRR